MITSDNPERFLREHIMLGDAGDGVPNFLSDDDTFVTNKRQKPLARAKLEKWVTMNPDDFCVGEMKRNYMRNEKLIDLSNIPDKIQREVLEMYENTTPPPRSGVLNYFVQSRLKNLAENIGEF
jgi:hypothetical protein